MKEQKINRRQKSITEEINGGKKQKKKENKGRYQKKKVFKKK